MQYLEFFETRRGLKSLFVAQLLCVVFFIFDAIREFLNLPHKFGGFDFEIFEFMIVIVMVLSMFITARQLRISRKKAHNLQDKLRAASGEFNAMLMQSFEEWGLTSSEKDVALLAIKGFGIQEISKMRETKEGTVKAQLNAIYRKADVSGRPQLISYFVEELMNDDLLKDSEPLS
ncbi:MAG: helix-turn-helix transcriptional regulator [Lentilitoribacter sp.]